MHPVIIDMQGNFPYAPTKIEQGKSLLPRRAMNYFSSRRET